jgi:predicted metalloprotease with PDZ domain
MVGQKVVSINGQECPESTKDAIAMVKDCVGPLTIVAVDVLKKKPAVGITSRSLGVGSVNVEKETEQKEHVPPPPPAKPVEAIVLKQEKDSRVGISLGQAKDCVVIYQIDKPGLFAYTNVSVGQKLVSINGVDCPETAKEAFALIKDCVGKLTIVAMDTTSEVEAASTKERECVLLEEGQVVASAVKESKEARLGIKCKLRGANRVVISTIVDDGLFADSDLRVGQTVISINGEPCPASAKEATDHIKAAVGEVTIVAANTVATVQKSEKGCKVGISFGKAEDCVVICKIEDDSLFAGSSLRLGQKVVSINGQECPESTQDAIALVKDCEGSLTILAVDTVKAYVSKPIKDTPKTEAAEEQAKPEKEKEELKVEDAAKEETSDEKKEFVAQETQASAEKAEKDTKVGIKMGKKGEDILIINISEEGLFASSDLKAGQKVVSINGTACPGSPKDAIALVKECVGTLTIVAVNVE